VTITPKSIVEAQVHAYYDETAERAGEIADDILAALTAGGYVLTPREGLPVPGGTTGEHDCSPARGR